MSKPIPQGPFIKGVIASAENLAQPKGSYPRSSNLLLTRRGSLRTCDGSAIIDWFDGFIQTNFGNFMGIVLFQPINITNYYLALVKSFDQPLAAPNALAAGISGSGGTLPTGTYYYVVTALDGAGGETTPSPEASIAVTLGNDVSLTWTLVPNAAGYNIYRGTSPGGETLLAGTGLPATTNTFVDTGAATAAPASATIVGTLGLDATGTAMVNAVITPSIPLGALGAGTGATISGATPTSFNGPGYTLLQQSNGVTLFLTNPLGVPVGTIGANGTITFAVTPPTSNTTQQVALYKMPLGSIPVTFTTGNIVKLFPADLRPNPGGAGGGGSSGGGGSTGGGTGGSGGAPPGALGGVAANLSPLPQLIQFQNTIIMALGNGYPPQQFTDPSTVTAITSTFVPAYPAWSASTNIAVGTIIQPVTPNGFYYEATQAGITAATEPTPWPTTVGVTNTEKPGGTVIWVNKGLLNTGAPPPPGAAHCIAYAGSLWVGNTWINDTSNGLDGPSCIRMSDVNEPNSWNPINQAFLDKDDGTQIQGFAAFTITAQGIPPSGSLVAFKDFSTFQIQGVFGSQDFAIQRIKSDMGCIAPRSIQFVPGFGIARLAHLGVAVFDGVEDRVISEEIRPYLFPSNSIDLADITVLDYNYAYSSFGFQTASPPTYCLLIPIGNSGGKLTRILSYDLVLRAWTVIDLPFALSTATQVRLPGSVPITLFGGWQDGTIQRWQAGDINWYTGDNAGNSVPVAWRFRTPEAFNAATDQRLYVRNHVIRGINTNSVAPLIVTPAYDGKDQPSIRTNTLPSTGDFDIFVPIGATLLRIHATIAGSGDVEVMGLDWHVDERPLKVPRTVA